MKKLQFFAISIVLVFFTFATFAQRTFLHTQGQQLVDYNGNKVLLRGMGMGGWMIQEGYMLGTSGFAGTQHEIKAKIEALVGKEAMDAFYAAWLKNYCTRQDVDSMAAWGFNSIRLPMHYDLFTLPVEEEPVKGKNTWLKKGFQMVDSLAEWCAENHMYLILDLHATPGGQGKDSNISDYDPSKPSLWESAENQDKTVALWKKIAERYAGNPWIGGYDLINEPNWDIDNAGNEHGCNCNENTALWKLYKRIITAIRTVDRNHLVIIEGNCWGNNYNGLPPTNALDSDLVISFHKYWNYNNSSAIHTILNLRDQNDAPIWLGESGENSNTWFTNAIHLAEKNHIGWSWWPYKKLTSVTGTVTVPVTAGFRKLLDYWAQGGVKPSRAEARKWLLEQADCLRLDSCEIHYDVLDAMFRQAQGDKLPKAFKKHELPGIVFAVDYDLGANGYAYYDVDTADYHSVSGHFSAWNIGSNYRNDGVDIQVCKDKISDGYNVWKTEDGEWLTYSVDVAKAGVYFVTVRMRGAGGQFHLELNGKRITTSLCVDKSGKKWTTVAVGNMVLPAGKQHVRFCVDKGGFQLNYLRFQSGVLVR